MIKIEKTQEFINDEPKEPRFSIQKWENYNPPEETPDFRYLNSIQISSTELLQLKEELSKININN